MEWTFGTFLWGMLVFFFWFMLISMFIFVLVDVFRRDMSGWAKAGWIALIVVLPLLGILVYLIARPRDADMDLFGGGPTYRPTGGGRAADEIATAARLYDEGKVSADEFESLKQKALSS